MKKILIADDHVIVRTGLILLIKEELDQVEIDECRDGEGTRKMIQNNEYDLIILDISMPFTDSFALLSYIFALRPKQKVLILTMSREDVYAKKFLNLGAKGFINKEADRSEIRKAIGCTLNNKRYLSSRMHDTLTGEMLDEINPNPFEALSPRELEIMNHLLEGKSISEIASILFLHISTVSTHKTNFMQKLGVSNIIELSKMVQMF
jgi:DNA-binding NarL/FixJ family response regulator